MVITAVVALGREGVWRLQHVDFTLSDMEVKEKIQSAHLILQPEEYGEYALIELTAGKLYSFSCI